MPTLLTALLLSESHDDRHKGNWMVQKDGKLALIDNGLAFPESKDINVVRGFNGGGGTCLERKRHRAAGLFLFLIYHPHAAFTQKPQNPIPANGGRQSRPNRLDSVGRGNPGDFVHSLCHIRKLGRTLISCVSA